MFGGARFRILLRRKLIQGNRHLKSLSDLNRLNVHHPPTWMVGSVKHGKSSKILLNITPNFYIGIRFFGELLAAFRLDYALKLHFARQIEILISFKNCLRLPTVSNSRVDEPIPISVSVYGSPTFVSF
ncbi:hypothetical protein FHW37_102792 [Neorhizobium alkalisoli]|uniref:Uncharacterized protein n=1 Tax=Neorhizobium alkalisoli TaxID=528178 RepID=A0A561R3I9_9HYPH|nr:hypothetical protein FHW37_102792 [Neorhizobium alkalisoli]